LLFLDREFVGWLQSWFTFCDGIAEFFTADWCGLDIVFKSGLLGVLPQFLMALLTADVRQINTDKRR
jgi:hypothetical protein